MPEAADNFSPVATGTLEAIGMPEATGMLGAIGRLGATGTTAKSCTGEVRETLRC